MGRGLVAAAGVSVAALVPACAALLDVDDVLYATQDSSATADAAQERDSDGCVPQPEICGDGIAQGCNGVDSICPANDNAAHAIDVTDGGLFPDASIRGAHADLRGGGCGAGGDVFYKVVPQAPTVYYFDTLGSDVDTVIRVYSGSPCSGVLPNAAPTACADDACATKQSQVAWAMPASESCIVVAQKSASEINGGLTFAAVATKRATNPLPVPLDGGAAYVSGNTCNSVTSFVASSCTWPHGAPDPNAGGKDDAYFFTLCPGTASFVATTCYAGQVNTQFDSVVYLTSATGSISGCDVDNGGVGCGTADSNLVLQQGGPGVFFVGVTESSSGACGAYDLKVTF